MRPAVHGLAPRAIGAVLMLVGLVSPARARPASSPEARPPVVPTAVSAVLATPCTGGDFAGRCRVIVEQRGFEHLSSRVWLEWLSIPEHGAPRRVRWVALPELSGGMWVVSPIPGAPVGAVWLDATHTYSQEARRAAVVFGAPGRYRFEER